MVLLIDKICQFLSCSKNNLIILLNNPIIKSQIENKFMGSLLKTNYKNKNNNYHYFNFSGLSKRDSKHQFAYNGFCQVTVLQHFYCRHRILVKYYSLPCVIEYTINSKANYYPIELLEILE